IGTHYSNTSIFDLYILKTDSVGNIQWTRTHGTPATKEEGYDLMQINDNGYLIWGSTYTGTPFGTFGGYLIKSDSIGLAGCQEDSLIIPNNNLSVNVIPLNLADSLMPLNILSSNVTIVSEPLPQISNGCFLTTGNEELLNHNLPYNITSYPNPTKGKITIKTHETTNALDYITVYDSLGKTVLQYPDINGKHELDLSKLAKGTYTIKVVQKDKVSVSKVVVE